MENKEIQDDFRNKVLDLNRKLHEHYDHAVETMTEIRNFVASYYADDPRMSFKIQDVLSMEAWDLFQRLTWQSVGGHSAIDSVII